jgi:hypothetical protein
MNIDITLDNAEKTSVSLHRNSFSGSFTCMINGKVHKLRSLKRISTHLNLSFKKNFEIDVNGGTLRIMHQRPVFFGGFRPNKYEVYFNDKLVAEYKGY